MPEANAKITMRLAAVTSNIDGRYMELRVEDATSGLPVLCVPLNGNDLMAMLSNAQVGDVDGIPAWLVEPAQRPHLGRPMIHLSRNVDSRPPKSWEPPPWSTDRMKAWTERIADWADEVRRVILFHSTTQTPTNTGKTRVTFRCYVPEGYDQADYLAKAEYILNSVPGPDGRS